MTPQQLRKIAEAATPGPWFYEATGKKYTPIGDTRASNLTIGTGCLQLTHGSRFDAQFIATFNPVLCLKLLDLWEAAKDLKEYETTGGPRYTDWDKRYDAIYDAVAALEEA